MVWVMLAGLTAFWESLKDLASKYNVQRCDPYVVAWALFVFSLPVLLPPLFWTGIPAIAPGFGSALAWSGFLNLIAMVLYVLALRHGEMAQVVPLVTLTPVLLLFTSPLMVGEANHWSDGLGIALIALGAYGLNFAPGQAWYGPFQRLSQDRGSQLMLGVVLIWGVTANLDKVGVRASSPVFWAFCDYLVMAIGLVPLLLWRRSWGALGKQWRSLAPVGVFQGLSVLFQMYALLYTTVPEVIAIKRLSVLLSVVWGYLWFKEGHLRQRLGAAALMVLGVGVLLLI